jgi:hypothetical protein
MDVFWHALQALWIILLQCFKAIWTIITSTEFISALAGAFFGVTGAFLLESRRKRHETKDRDYEAFLRTQAVIISQGNALAWIAKDYSTPEAFNNYKTIVLTFTRQMLDFKDLAFIAKSSNPQLLIELDVANESYDFFRRLLEARNAAIESYLRHPETKIIKLDVTTGQFLAAGLKHLEFNVQETNREVPRSLAHAMRYNETATQHLLSFGQREFPGRRVLRASENPSSESAA